MAFKMSAIVNFITDQGYSAAEIAAIKGRAKIAVDEFDAGEAIFSGGKIEYVLGSEERVKTYMKKRETNLARYS